MDALPSLTDLPGLDSTIGGGQSRKRKYPKLPADEEKSILRRIGHLGIGALQYLGETIDKPGRALRGTLAGKPSELANLVPFSDTVGLTDPAESVSGKELLQTHGLQKKGAEGFLPGLAGFAAEVATDPLSYLTLGAGAATKAGKVAKAAGISAKGAELAKPLGQHLAQALPETVKAAETAAKATGTTLDALKAEPLAGAFGLTTGPLGLFGLHGTHVPAIAKTPGAQKAAQAVGKTVRAVPGVARAETFAKGLFHAPAQGQFNELGQQMAEAGTKSLEHSMPAIRHETLQKMDELANLVDDFHKANGTQIAGATAADTLRQAGQIVRQAVQHGGETRGVETFSAVAPNMAGATAFHKRAADLGTGLAASQDALYNQLAARGFDVHRLQEYSDFGHLARTPATREKRLNVMKSRAESRRYLPAAHFETMLHDPSLMYGPTTGIGAKVTAKSLDTEANIAKKLLGPAYLKQVQDTAVRSGKTAQQTAEEIAGSLYQKGTSFLTQSKPYYSDEILKNHLNAMTGMARKLSNADAVHGMFAKNLTPSRAGTVPIAQALANAGMEDAAAGVAHLAKLTGHAPAELAALRIPEDVASAASNLMTKTAKPEYFNAITDAIDGFTKAWKWHVTMPFVSFLTRNFASGQFMNVLDDSVPSIKHAMKLLVGKNAEARAILENPAAHKALINEAVAHGAIDPENLASLGVDLGWATNQLPNPVSLKGMGQNVKQGWQAARDLAHNPEGPLGKLVAKVPGGKAVRTALETPAQIGARANQQVEFSNRMSKYLYLRSEGWAPEAAARRVRELQVDYRRMTPFERDVMRRVAPFYMYARSTVPVMLEQIRTRPGGMTAQTIRASNVGRGRDEFVPPYVGEAMSLPLGEGRYLSGLGLPTDQFSDLAVYGPTVRGGASRTLQKGLGQTNPLIKGPLEFAFGQNLFSGQPIEESYRSPTSSITMNQVLNNLPTSRYLTTARQLTDPRKGIGAKAANVLTGARINDVSGGLERQERIAEAKTLTELLREHPEFSSSVDVYPRKDQATGKTVPLPAEAKKLYQAYLALKQKQQAEGRKKGKRKSAMPSLPGL